MAVQPGFLEQYRVAQAQPAPPKPDLWVILLPWLIAIAVLTGFLVYGLLTPYETRLPPSKAGALVWGNGIFANKREFSGWLRQHGSGYAAWKKMHPAAAKFLVPKKHLRQHPSATTRTHAKRPLPKATLAHSADEVTAPVTRKATPTPTQSAREARSRSTWILLGILGLLITFASTSVIRARRGRVERLRPAFSAALDLLHADVVVRTADVARVTDIGRDTLGYSRVRTVCRRSLLYLSVCGAAVAVGWLASLAGRF